MTAPVVVLAVWGVVLQLQRKKAAEAEAAEAGAGVRPQEGLQDSLKKLLASVAP